MSAAERTAKVSWSGNLLSGTGKIEFTGSGALAGADMTWASRSEPDEDGRTSPEELIAAAHASCFSMALSHGLAQAGTPPDRLNVQATSTFVPGTGITAMKLDVTGDVSPAWICRAFVRPENQFEGMETVVPEGAMELFRS